MHKFSTAATISSALPALHDPQAGTPRLLNVLKSTFAGVDPHKRVPLVRQSEPQALACGPRGLKPTALFSGACGTSSREPMHNPGSRGFQDH